MQQIRYEFRIRVRRGLVNDGFQSRIEEAITKVPGVTYVGGRRFMFVVQIARPREEKSKDISEELKEAFWDVDGVVEVRLVNWSRY